MDPQGRDHTYACLRSPPSRRVSSGDRSKTNTDKTLKSVYRSGRSRLHWLVSVSRRIPGDTETIQESLGTTLDTILVCLFYPVCAPTIHLFHWRVLCNPKRRSKVVHWSRVHLGNHHERFSLRTRTQSVVSTFPTKERTSSILLETCFKQNHWISLRRELFHFSQNSLRSDFVKMTRLNEFTKDRIK